MVINKDLLRSMRVAKLYTDNQDQITNIDYSNDGMNIITSSADDQIIIYDCEKGTSQKSINSKKYGVDLIHFTQNKHHAVHASTKENDIIRWEKCCVQVSRAQPCLSSPPLTLPEQRSLWMTFDILRLSVKWNVLSFINF